MLARAAGYGWGAAQLALQGAAAAAGGCAWRGGCAGRDAGAGGERARSRPHAAGLSCARQCGAAAAGAPGGARLPSSPAPMPRPAGRPVVRGFASGPAPAVPDVPELVAGILEGRRLSISRGITLCESTNPAHQLKVRRRAPARA